MTPRELSKIIRHVANKIKPQIGIPNQFSLAIRLLHGYNMLTDCEQFLAAILALYIVSNQRTKKEIAIYLHRLIQVFDFIESCGSDNPKPVPPLTANASPLGLLTLWANVKGQINAENESKRKVVN